MPASSKSYFRNKNFKKIPKKEVIHNYIERYSFVGKWENYKIHMVTMTTIYFRNNKNTNNIIRKEIIHSYVNKKQSYVSKQQSYVSKQLIVVQGHSQASSTIVVQAHSIQYYI